jgi:N-acetylmuramoyl-L-alanine amidase
VPVPHLRSLVPALLLVLAACGGVPVPSQTAPHSSATDASAAPTSSGSAPGFAIGEVVPAPGSGSELYAPNPRAIVVAIDPGHGGCLDFGVPDPSKRGPAHAEKTMTLGIGLALRRLLETQGVTAVMTRTTDDALAGDDYPQLGCNGPPWRDVNGDGKAGFDRAGSTRTRDELSARIDLANLARADVLVSIHINSMTQNGVAYKIAATQTFYDDETPWGTSRSSALARDIQADVVRQLDGLAPYARQDRHTQAISYYMVGRQWAAGDTCDDGGIWCKPHRGLQMPGVLSEVGSISLAAEQDLLVSDAGQQAAAEGVYRGLVSYFNQRPLAVRYDALLPGGEAAAQPKAVAGQGPLFWAAQLPGASGGSTVELPVRLTNSGTQAWPSGLRLMAGWQPSKDPYLSSAPPDLKPIDVQVPALAPGASVVLKLPLVVPADEGRQLVWIGLGDGSHSLADEGSPALQVASGG